MTVSQSWQEAASKAKQHCEDTLAEVPGSIPHITKELTRNVTGVPGELLSKEDLKITNQNAEQLLDSLAAQRVTSVAITTAFLRQAALAQRLVNCVTELLPRQALERAGGLDDYIKKHGKPIGPLHGLPISVKEHIGMEGLTLTGGFCIQASNKAESNATVLEILSKAGAIFHARTSEPQTMMHLETSSNLYGITTNPYNRDLTAGGSSGGEGALQALRGSVLGIGSDIGGSIRSPAANNGLFGLKPSVYRLPVSGSTFAMRGNEQILGTSGPISTSLAGIKIYMKSVIDRRPWIVEPWLTPLPWTNFEDIFGVSRRLRIAIMWDDGVVRPHPPVTRALKEMVSNLRQDTGIELTEWTPWRHDYAWDLISRLYFTDGAKSELSLLHASGEPLRPLSRFILEDQPGIKELNGREIWAVTNERNQYRAEYNDKWNATATGLDSLGNPTGAVDVILCPAGPGAAPPLDCARYWGYTSQWNLLDYSALTFPVSKVEPSQDHADTLYVPRNEKDKYNHALYEPERYLDAPISLQLVGRRYEEEKLIAAMEYIQKLL